MLAPDYLTTNQPEEFHQLIMHPTFPLPHSVFKNLSLKAIRESVPGLLAWCPTINTAFLNYKKKKKEEMEV